MKKKLLKILLILALLFGLGLTAIVCLVFSSGFQTKLVNDVLAKGEGAEGRVERIHAGLSSFEMDGLSVSQNGAKVEIGKVAASISVLKAMTSNVVEIPEFIVSGVSIDLSAVDLSESDKRSENSEVVFAEEPVEEFNGVFQRTEQGYLLSLGKLQIDGTVILPDKRSGTLNISGGEIKPGSTGKIKIGLTLNDASPKAEIGKVEYVGELALTQGDLPGLKQILFDAIAKASGAAINGEVAIKKKVILEALDGSKEKYAADVFYVDGAGKEASLVESAIVFDSAVGKLDGQYKLNILSSQIAPFAMGLAMPEFKITGSGNCGVNPGGKAGTLTSNVKIEASSFTNLLSNMKASGMDPVQLRQIQLFLESLGSLAIDSNVNLDFSETALELEQLDLKISEGSGAPLFTLNNKKKLSFVAGESGVALRDGDGELAAIKISKLPISWFSPFVSNAYLTGGDINGELALQYEQGAVLLKTLAPITLGQLGLALPKEDGSRDPVLGDIDVMLSPSVAIQGNKISLGIETLKGVSKNDMLFNIVAAADIIQQDGKDPDVATKGKFVFHLHHFLKQPMARDFSGKSPGELHFSGDFGVGVSSGQLAVERLTTYLKQGADSTLLSVDLLQKFTMPLSGDIDLSKMLQGDLLKMEIASIPLSMLSPYVPGYTVTGDNIAGSMVLAGKGDAFVFQSTNPLSIGRISIKEGYNEVLDELDLLCDFSAHYNKESIAFELKQFDLKQRNIPVVNGSLTGRLASNKNTNGGSYALESAKAKFVVELPRLFKQPVLGLRGKLLRGQADLDVDVDLVKARAAKVSGKLSNLLLPKGSKSIAEVSLNTVARIKENGGISATIPLKIKGKGSSDFSLGLMYEPSGNVKRFSVNAAGKIIVAEDLQTLAEAFSPDSTEETSGVSTRRETRSTGIDNTPDTAPVWAGYNGNVDLKIDRLALQDGSAFDQLVGRIKVDDRSVQVEKFEANFNKDKFTTNGYLNFVSGARPYELNAEMRFPNFDVGAYLQNLNPRDLPFVEGLVNIFGMASGKAPNLATIVEYITGDFKFSCDGGKFRPMSGSGSKGNAVRTGGALLSVAGGLLGGKVKELGHIDKLIQELEVIEFEKLNVSARRGENLDILIDEIKLLSPDVHLSGSGSIKHAKNIPVSNQDLNVGVLIAAKPESSIAYYLNRAYFLRDKLDDLGYLQGPTYQMTGSLAESKSNLTKIITDSAVRGLTGGKRVDLDKYVDGGAKAPEGAPAETQTPNADTTPETANAVPEEKEEPSDLEKGLNILNQFLKKD